MGKNRFTAEEKIGMVEQHLREGKGNQWISERYGVSPKTLCDWIEKHKVFGAEGLMERKRNHSYTAELKRCAVEEYHGISAQDTKFIQKSSCEIGLRCIIVMENYDPAEVEGVISI